MIGAAEGSGLARETSTLDRARGANYIRLQGRPRTVAFPLGQLGQPHGRIMRLIAKVTFERLMAMLNA